MPLSHPYQCVPIGSLSLLPEQERLGYIDLFYTAPPSLNLLLSSPDTGSYVRGIAKTYDIPEDQSPKIAQCIFFITVGKRKIGELSTMLSAELGLPNDIAQKISSEIEKDVFGPIKNELDTFVISQRKAHETVKKNPTSNPQPQNVLNLKEIGTSKKQNQLPPKPLTPRFPLPTKTTAVPIKPLDFT